MTTKIQIGKYEINIKEDGNHGWLERDGEAIAGLWFENGKLSDYDGVSQLPAIVVDHLIIGGFIDERDRDNY